jgi:hypothetical protein
LLLQISLLQGHDKAHEPNGVQSEADNSMVGSEREQLRIREHDVLRHRLDRRCLKVLILTYLEIIDDALAIQEVIRDDEEIPVECGAPGVPASLFGFFFGRGQYEQCSDFSIDKGLA